MIETKEKESIEEIMLRKHGYTLDVMTKAEKNIQRHPMNHYVTCERCFDTYLIRITEYLDVKHGKQVVFLCPRCNGGVF